MILASPAYVTFEGSGGSVPAVDAAGCASTDGAGSWAGGPQANALRGRLATRRTRTIAGGNRDLEAKQNGQRDAGR